jgi:plastocyanin
MRRLVAIGASLLLVAMVTSSCGGDGGSSNSGEERTVLVDYRHDEFASSFIHYYPSKITVRPGDRVTFRQSWTGEPHSVTMGKVVDDAFELAPKVEQYANEEEARAGGLDEATISRAVATFSKLPSMTDQDNKIYQPGAQPCFVADYDDIPNFSDAGEHPDPSAKCPTAGKPQPAFNGRQGLYNSGFIPYQGSRGNTFELPIAEDATPGTYKYFCNDHYFSMNGTVEVVGKGKAIPSADEVRRQAQREIAKDASGPLAQVAKAEDGVFGDAKPPLIGLSTADDEEFVSINEFFPRKVAAKVGEPVTWSAQGFVHTLSFNVPKYFPIFRVDKSGKVTWDPKSYEPGAWKVPAMPEGAGPEDPPPPRAVDVGEWNGGGGFHSSGLLVGGDTFTVTFTKAGTYPFACVLHPQMVGTLVVKA